MNIKQVQPETALNFLEEIARPYLEARPHKYYFLVMEHKDKLHLCPSLGYVKQTENQKLSAKNYKENINTG